MVELTSVDMVLIFFPFLFFSINIPQEHYIRTEPLSSDIELKYFLHEDM